MCRLCTRNDHQQPWACSPNGEGLRHLTTEGDSDKNWNPLFTTRRLPVRADLMILVVSGPWQEDTSCLEYSSLEGVCAVERCVARGCCIQENSGHFVG